MDERLLLRELYGPETYVTVLTDGQRIPWKPLSIGDYLYYESKFESNEYPNAFIENEVFRKCVLNAVLVKQIDKLRAGIVSTVVFTIMQYSAPQTIDGLQHLLNISRIKANTVLHDLVNLVCQAYPGHTPDELYRMNTETFMARVALAERKLLNSGLLKEPLAFTSQEEAPPVKPQPKVAKPPPTNMAKAYEQQKAPANKTVITKKDMQEHQAAYTGHEKEDKLLLEHRMVKDTEGIYADYLKDMKDGKPFTPKTDEERKAIALARAKKNEQAYAAMMAKKSDKEKAELEKLAQERKAKRTAKQKR